jgi:hypothetical protein
MAATSCVCCTKSIEGSDVYLRPGDGCPVCVKCYFRANHSSLRPPEPIGGTSWPAGSSDSAGQLVAGIAGDLIIDLITD